MNQEVKNGQPGYPGVLLKLPGIRLLLQVYFFMKKGGTGMV
jgi:hypothetical protein